MSTVALKAKAIKSQNGLPHKENELAILTIETGVPLPERGERDPEFNAKVRGIIGKLKIGQSFVVTKQKLGTVAALAKKDFPEFHLRKAIILPGKTFCRFWRVS